MENQQKIEKPITDISKVFKDEVKQYKEQNSQDNMKEQKSLKKYKCPENVNKVFVIQNKRNGRIVEIKAPTIMLAASAVGWRVRHTVLIEEKLIEDKPIQGETSER